LQKVGDTYYNKHRMFDFHNHYTNWIQAGSDFSGLINAMDMVGVEKVAICGLPTIPLDGHYAIDTKTDSNLLGQYEKLSDDYKRRIFPFVCGINPENPMAVRYVKNLLSIYPSSIFGIGEVLCRHDTMSMKIFGKEIPPNTPTMLELSDLATEYGLPILLHSNVAKSGDVEPVYLAEIEELLAHNRETKIVWAHCGISKDINNIPLSLLLDTLEQMFLKYKNLYVDLSWRVFDYYIENNEEEWSQLIEKYPERFLLGTDHTGKWEEYSATVHRYDILNDLLSERSRNMVKNENAEMIIPNSVKV